jgi:Protein of unknown function (DUF1761)
MEFNWLVVFSTSLIPLLVGFVWYNPKVLGNAWMKAANMKQEDMEGSNMALIFGLTLLFGIFTAVATTQLVVHQSHYYSILADNKDMADPSSAIAQATNRFMAENGSNFRTFKHGVLHGMLMTIFLILPVIGINSLFERRSSKYVMIHVGYWLVTLGLMGGIISAFA